MVDREESKATPRGELEITDVNKQYLEWGPEVGVLDRETAGQIPVLLPAFSRPVSSLCYRGAPGLESGLYRRDCLRARLH